MLCAEFDDSGSGPESGFSRFIRDESAMAAVFGRNELDTWVLCDRCLVERREWHERIILRGKNQARSADLADDFTGARARVVIIRAGEAAESGCDSLVEIAHAPDIAHAINRK